MEYRIEASLVVEPNYIAQLVMAWYREPASRQVPSTAVSRLHTGQVPGQLTSQRFGVFTAGANVRQGNQVGTTAAERATWSLAQRNATSQRASTVPISTLPGVTQTETNFSIGLNVRLRKMSGLGDFKIDYFFWQNDQVLVVERLSGRHYWVKLKEGWNNPQVANPKPINLGRFNANEPMTVPVSQMTDAEKLAETARRAIPLIVEKGGEAVRDQVESLLDPETIATMLVIGGVSVFFPVVGVGFAILGAYYLGDDAIDVLKNLVEFVSKAKGAQTDADLDQAAVYLAEAMVVGGVIAWELLSKKRSKGRKLVKKQPNADAKSTPVAKTPEPKIIKPNKKAAPEQNELEAPKKLVAGTPEHKAQRWEQYKDKGGKWSYERWSKQYDTNMQNASHGLNREAKYREMLGGESKTVKTPFTNRQIDIYQAEGDYMGQLKTGRMTLTKQAKIDIQKDKYLLESGANVEYILEKGASKNFLDALDEAGIPYKIGPQIPQ